MTNKHHQYESALASALLKKIAKSTKTRILLHHLGERLAQHVLLPLEALLNEENSDIASWPSHYKDVLINMAKNHSGTEKQYGSVLSHYHGDDDYNPIDIYSNYLSILNDPNNISVLLQSLRNAIDAVIQQTDMLSIVKATKVIVDMGFCYRQFFPQTLKSHRYERLDSLLWPTPLEFLNRLPRAEIGHKNYLQNTPGIGHELGQGFVLSDGEGRRSGGANWGLVNTKASLVNKLKKYDFLSYELKRLPTQSERRDDVLSRIHKLEEELRELHVPLEKYKRLGVMDKLFARWETTLEKTARQTHMPLIASASGSTARSLIALLDIDVFTHDGYIDLENIQIFSNCIMAFFIHAGHHSFLEVAEIYNRAIDWVVIEQSDAIQRSLLEKMIDNNGYAERHLPYFKYGDYSSFIHVEFQDIFLTLDELQMSGEDQKNEDPVIPGYFFRQQKKEKSSKTDDSSSVLPAFNFS